MKEEQRRWKCEIYETPTTHGGDTWHNIINIIQPCGRNSQPRVHESKRGLSSTNTSCRKRPPGRGKCPEGCRIKRGWVRERRERGEETRPWECQEEHTGPRASGDRERQRETERWRGEARKRGGSRGCWTRCSTHTRANTISHKGGRAQYGVTKDHPRGRLAANKSRYGSYDAPRNPLRKLWESKKRDTRVEPQDWCTSRPLEQVQGNEGRK